MKPKSSLHWSGEDKVKLLCNPKKFLKFPSSWHCFEKTWAPALQRHHMIEGICKYGKWLMWDEGINSISLYHGYSNPYHAAYQPLIMLHTNLHLWYFRFVSWISNPTSLIWKKKGGLHSPEPTVRSENWWQRKTILLPFGAFRPFFSGTNCLRVMKGKETYPQKN